MVLSRLLQDFGRDDYCLVSPEPYAENNGVYTERLDAPFYPLPAPARINRGHRFGLRYLREGLNIPLTVLQYAQFLKNILRRERCEAIVGCTGDLRHLPAVMLASRGVGIPFYAYIFDHYSYREWQDYAAIFWARRFERRVLKTAAAVVVPNAVLREDLRLRFGIEPAVIHNSLDITPYRMTEPPRRTEKPREYKIVYTGDIYEAQFDAFRNLLQAVSDLKRSDLRVHLYTSRNIQNIPTDLSRVLVRHEHLAASEIPPIQMDADVLFLPLAFDSPYPELIRTSATTKLGEYLAARKPIIVHAPRDSFVSQYIRQHKCGVVVDQNEPALLGSAVTQILTNTGLREELTANAWQRAQADFDIVRARKSFRELLRDSIGKTAVNQEHLPG
jgi:glycosyltransferase involved in cell wall biosynthesis